MWSEVNSRLNYPIKAVLVELIEKGMLNVDDSLHLFCASWLSVRVSFVSLWNHGIIIQYHVLMGLGSAVFFTIIGYVGRKKSTIHAHIPYQLVQKCNKAVKIDQHLISCDDAVHMYQMNGGTITDPDPLY